MKVSGAAQMLRGLGRQMAGDSPTSSIHLVRHSDGDAMHGAKLRRPGLASYQISRLLLCCWRTGPGLVLSLVPLLWARVVRERAASRRMPVLEATDGPPVALRGAWELQRARLGCAGRGVPRGALA